MGIKAKRTILIVHDNPEMRELFIHLLGREDFELYTAQDAEQAFEIIEKKSIELAFLDRYIPGMDGLEILERIKKTKPLIKVIMLNSDVDRHARSRILKMGAFGCLTKPFRLGNVLKMVERALGIILIERKVSPFEEEDGSKIFEQAFSYRIPEANRRRYIWLLIVICVCIGCIGSGLLGFYYHRSDNVYQTPYANPTALTWDGRTLWVSDWVTQSYYQHEPKRDFTVSTVCYVQGSHPTGLTWDGKTIWSCNAWEKKIYQHRMDSTLKILKEYKSPGPYPTALYFDGIYLWVCDSKTFSIYKTEIKHNKLEILATYRSPGREPVGMFSDGNNFWTADAETGYLYKHAFDNKLTVQGMYAFKQYENGRDRLTGMTWDGKHIWTCSEDTRRIYRHHLHNLIQVIP